MKFPNFGGSINLGQVVLAAANTATDGSGTIGVLLTGAGKFTNLATFSLGTNSKILCTVPNWDMISSEIVGYVKNGDIVTITTTAGIPTGLAITTDYIISGLSVSANSATFFLVTNALAPATIAYTDAGTAPHVLRFPGGTRVDEINFINSQLTAAASGANVGKLFMKPRNSSTWFPIREVALPTLTRSTTVIGNRQTMTFTGGLFVPEGAQLGATIAVWASAVDTTTVYAVQSSNF
jgi:hypothetical protein